MPTPSPDAAALTYDAAIMELEELGIMPERAPSLEPMRRALERQGLTKHFRPERTIVVAGTNGKGSTCATLEALLRDTGASTALYSSPHLEHTTERLRLDGVDIGREAFVALYGEIRETVLALKLSHFEALTLLAAQACFAPNRTTPDWVILEVGMGGLWDATNAIPHDHSVICRLGMDHQRYLGATLPLIAANKFGIVPSRDDAAGRKLTITHAPFAPEVESVAREFQTRTETTWVCAPTLTHSVRPVAGELDPEHWIDGPWGAARVRLAGARGAENTAVALATFTALGFDPKPHLAALEQVRWPGRLERLTPREFPGLAPFRAPVYASGDHNLQGIESLIACLSDYPARRYWILAGIGGEKDVAPMLGLLYAIPGARVALTETPFRGANPRSYPPALQARALFVEPDPLRALKQLGTRYAEPGDRIVITGSLYLVGALRAALRPPLGSVV